MKKKQRLVPGKMIRALLPADGSWVSLAKLTEQTRAFLTDTQAVAVIMRVAKRSPMHYALPRDVDGLAALGRWHAIKESLHKNHAAIEYRDMGDIRQYRRKP